MSPRKTPVPATPKKRLDNRRTPLTKVTRTKTPKLPKIEQFQIGFNGGHDEDIKDCEFVYVVEAPTSAQAAFVALGDFVRRHPREQIDDIMIVDDPENEVVFLPWVVPAPVPDSGPAALPIE